MSTAGEVLRYTYDAKAHVSSGLPEVIVSGIPPDGELTTRPILLHPSDDRSRRIVSSSLSTNIDTTARDPAHSSAPSRLPTNTAGVLDFFSGTLLAFGIRNPAGFAFRPRARAHRLWVLNNGASLDGVPKLTAAFVNNNPTDELNLVNMRESGSGSGVAFDGFPNCTTIWNASADPAGVPQFTSFVTGEQFSLELEPERDTAWCQAHANNRAPRLSF